MVILTPPLSYVIQSPPLQWKNVLHNFSMRCPQIWENYDPFLCGYKKAWIGGGGAPTLVFLGVGLGDRVPPERRHGILNDR